MVAAKMIVLTLTLGAPTAAAVWALVRIRHAYARVRAGLPHTDSSAASSETADQYAPAAAAEMDAVVAPDAADWDCVGLSAPLDVSIEDRDYYRRCWKHILGTYAHWPTTGLDLAETLTVNLMINRGLISPDSDRLRELPADWQFPTAQGYREARNIVERSRSAKPTARELSKALMLYRALFEEILAAPTSADALR